MTKIRLLVTIIFCLVLMAPVIQAQEDSSPPAETTEEAPIGVIIIDDPLGEETEIPTPVPTEEPTTPPTPEVTVEPTAEVTVEPTAEITAEPTEPTAEPPAPTETPVATPIVDIFSDNFESGISSHWVLSPGWILTQDNGSFLAAAAAGETALINGIDWPHFLLALRVRGPISIQFRSGTEAYRLAIAETGKASLYRGETLLAEGADAGAADAWHPVNIQALGGVITVAVDRVAQFTYTDPSPLDTGAIRFVSDGAAAFDDVVLNKLDAPLPTPEPTEESTPEVQANFLLPADEPTEPAIFVVNSPRDNSTADDGLCTLREAIESANSSTGLVLYPECGSSAGTSIADNPDIIEFEMNDPLFVSPPYEILPFGCPLPDIIDQVIIDGYSQTGAEPATDSTFAVIRIELNGSNAFSSGACAANKSNGLHILEGGNGSTIKGLAITRFKANGIYIENASNVTISGNYIGLENGGSVPQPNLADGIFIDEGTFNTIGGLTAADRNLISSNTANGIHIKGVSTVTETTANNNIIQGNYIGLDRTGLLDRGNDKDGVFIDESEDNLVGGSVAGARNIISGNGDNGVQIKNLNEASGLSLANLVRGNYIGLNYNANGMVPNDDDGVRLSGTRGNTIGGTTAADRNIITGNAGYGVHITKATYQADYNVISGNFIGTNLNGTGLFTSATYNRTGNGLGGVFIEFGTNNYIGDAVAGAGNVIAGNRGNGSGTFYGIYITNNSAANRIYGNLIGVDVTGTVSLGNTVGIRISGPSQNFVGSTDPLTRNVISGNLTNGIELAGTGTTDTRVLGNYVGVNVTGNVALPNGGQGILISGAVNSVIGSTDAGATNVISGNTGDGIRLSGSNGVVSETNRIQNNYIGLGADGTTALGNGGNGINVMSFTQRNQIGTDPASPDPQGDIGGNIIAYNTLAGVAIPTDGGVGNSVMKNVIHTNGGLGIDLGNMGVTPNDGGDTDEGANHLQNFPIVTGVSRDSGNITITGSLNTTANSGFSPPLAYRIDFFGNATCDPSNYGEGRTYLDTLTWGDGRITQVGGSTSGNYTFEITIPEQPGVNRITLTATERRPTGTDFDYSTSEFSQCLDPDNNPPAITPIPMSSITTAHNTLSGPVNFNISDVETPVANLTLSATSSDPTIVSNIPSNFQFSCTTGSCTVRVRPNSGADAYGDVNITVIVTDADGASASSYFTLTVEPPNELPTISSIAPQFTEPSTPTSAIPFTVDDPDGDENQITLTYGSDNVTLVPQVAGNTYVEFGGSGANRTVLVKPATGQTGIVNITIIATDSDGGQGMRTFLLRVDENTPPTISSITPASTNSASFNQIKTLNFTVDDGETNAADLIVEATSSDQNIVAASGLEILTPNLSSPASKRVSMTPVSDAVGWTLITITVTDGNGASASTYFVQGFRASANSAVPGSFSIANKSTDMNVTVPTFQIATTDTQTANGLLQVYSFTNNPSLIGSLVISPHTDNAKRNVDITPATNQIGEVEILLVVDDTQGGVRGKVFTLTVLGPNQPPVVSEIDDQFTGIGQSTGPIPYTVSDDRTAVGSLAITRTSSNTTVVPLGGVVLGGSGASRTVTINPAAGQTGTSTISITVADKSTPALSTTITFLVTVSNNTPPTVSDINNQTTTIGIATHAIPFTVNDAQQSAATLVVTTTSSNTTLVPNANVVVGGAGGNRTLTITPAAGQQGTSTITVTVKDSTDLTASDTFVLTVLPNTAPTIANIGTQSIKPSTSTKINFTVGDGETPGRLQLSAVSSNTSVLPNSAIVFGGSGTNRNMTLNSGAQTGITNITVTVTDPAGETDQTTFEVSVYPQSPPSLKSPRNNSFSSRTKPRFTWKSVKTARNYQFQLATDANFSNIVLNETVDRPRFSFGRNDTALDYGTYYWRVKAVVNGGGDLTGWSKTFTFDLTVMKKLRDESFTRDTTPRFSWARASRNSTYVLLVDDNSDFSSPVADFCTRATSTSCTVPRSQPLPYGKYYWRVDVNGNPSPIVWTFTVTPNFPARVKLSQPRNNKQAPTNATLKWQAANNATSYMIEVATDSRFRNVVYSGEDITATQVTIPLTEGRYYWRVRGVNDYDAPGKWSSKWHFNVRAS